MVQTLFNNKVIAETENDEIVTIEGNKYFPPNSIKKEYFKPTDNHTICHWKGEASYYDIEVDGEKVADGAWYYPNPKEGSPQLVGKDFSNYVAFYTNRGIDIKEN